MEPKGNQRAAGMFPKTILFIIGSGGLNNGAASWALGPFWNHLAIVGALLDANVFKGPESTSFKENQHKIHNRSSKQGLRTNMIC